MPFSNASAADRSFRKLVPLLLACAALLALLVEAYLRIRSLGAAVQIFTLDDAYISAGIGRHILLDHTWGVSPHHFSSASSSILWPLLLAVGFAVAGVHMAVPFALNVIFGLLLLGLSWWWLRKEAASAPGWFTFAALLIVAVATPLPMMAFVGMEHTGFALASLLFLILSSRVLAHGVARGVSRQDWVLAVAAAFTCSLRYEGMFQVAVVAGLLLLTRRYLAAVVVGAGGALPIVSFGLFAMRHGAHFFPNSLLQKSGGGVGKLLRSVVLFIPNKGLLSHFSLVTGLFALWAFAVLLLVIDWRQRQNARSMLSSTMRFALLLWVLTVLLHCQFSQLNWLWRYESYLMATGSLFVLLGCWQASAALPIKTNPGLVAGAMLLCVCIPLASRAWNSFDDIPHSAYAIYEQQYQTGAFLARHYRGQPVVLNDIGVPSFASDADILDLAGLGSLEVTDLQLAHRFDSAAMKALAAQQHSRIAILYRKWFSGRTAPPSGWIEVGSWTIAPMDPRVPIADRTFTFFAITPEEVHALHNHLCADHTRLPADIQQTIVSPCSNRLQLLIWFWSWGRKPGLLSQAFFRFSALL